MGLMDSAKAALGKAKEQAGDLAHQHNSAIDTAIDKGGALINSKTGGKHASAISKGSQQAKDAADRLAEDSRRGSADAPAKHASPERIDLVRPDPDGPAAQHAAPSGDTAPSGDGPGATHDGNAERPGV